MSQNDRSPKCPFIAVAWSFTQHRLCAAMSALGIRSSNTIDRNSNQNHKQTNRPRQTTHLRCGRKQPTQKAVDKPKADQHRLSTNAELRHQQIFRFGVERRTQFVVHRTTSRDRECRGVRLTHVHTTGPGLV